MTAHLTRSVAKNQTPRSTGGVDREQHRGRFAQEKSISRGVFLYPARARLPVQSSSASAERPFDDTGYHEGLRRQHAESVTEMLLMIRSFVPSRIDNSPKQQGFLSSRAQAVKDLVEDIAGEMERTLALHTNDYLIE